MIKASVLNKDVFDRKTLVSLKFIVMKLKRMVMDSYGRVDYTSNGDNVFKDVFGNKNLFSKLDRASSNREVIVIIADFGFKELMTLCNIPKIYDAFCELVSMDVRRETIKKELRKAQKKGKKKDKDLIKELEYINNLYKDGVKSVRKRLGVNKKSNSYKNRYRTVADMVNTRGSIFYDDDDEYNSILFDDEDDDDFDEETEFDRFYKKMTGEKFSKKSRKKSKSQNRLNRFDFDDDDYDLDDFDDEDDDDIDEDEYDVDAEDNSKKIDRLTRQISTLSSAVQQMIQCQTDINQNDAYVIEKARLSGKLPGYDYSPEIQNHVADPNEKISKDIENLSRAVSDVVSVQRKLIENQNVMTQFLNEVMNQEDDDDDEEVVNYFDTDEAEEAYRRRKKQEALDRFHRQELEDDPGLRALVELEAEDRDNKDLGNLTREELIEIINSNNGTPDTIEGKFTVASQSVVETREDFVYEPKEGEEIIIADENKGNKIPKMKQ